MTERFKENEKALSAMSEEQSTLSEERRARFQSSRYPESPACEARAFLRPNGVLEVMTPQNRQEELRTGEGAMRWIEDEIKRVNTRLENMRLDLDHLYSMKRQIQEMDTRR